MKNQSGRWAFKIFVLSIFLSIVFSMVSQSIFPALPAFLSVFVVFFFISISGIFDMIGVAVTSTTKEKLQSFEGQKGYIMACKLCENTDKISSFCGDVVGDICGILSGAGGISLVLSIDIKNPTIYFITTCLISSFIAGLTIFLKAVLKTYAIKNGPKIVMKTARLIDSKPMSIFQRKKKRNL